MVPLVNTRVLLFASLVVPWGTRGCGFAHCARVCASAERWERCERRRGRGGGRRERLRAVLVIVEVTGCVALLASCGLLMKALWRGFQQVGPRISCRQRVLTLRTPLPMPKYEKLAAQIQFLDTVLSEARQLPGVIQAAYISFLPMVMRGGVWPVEVEGHPMPIAERQNASLRFVTPGFFAALGVPLRRGRDVSDTEHSRGSEGGSGERILCAPLLAQ